MLILPDVRTMMTKNYYSKVDLREYVDIVGCSHANDKRLLWLNTEDDADIVGRSHDDDKKLL